MNAHTGVIERRWRKDDELGFDRVPGMPLVGFFTGSLFSLGIWTLLGWIAWRFIG
jgi:hypothetical protein